MLRGKKFITLLLWTQSGIVISKFFKNSNLKYVTNKRIHCDLKMSTVKEEISKFSNRYTARLTNHSNPLSLITRLTDSTEKPID